MRKANPQGKGVVPVLRDWSSAQPATVQPKSAAHVLSDYFTSLLVLSAEFAFQPRQGVIYYLYRSSGNWRLSLISPTEWHADRPEVFVGKCQLTPDMTWQLEPREDLKSERDLVDALVDFHEDFREHLSTADSFEEGLPFYVAQLPYYRRLFASGLASSLSKSISLAGLEHHSQQQWLSTLTRQHSPLIALEQGRD